jgi:CDP-glycerol glycerophosphotransferase
MKRYEAMFATSAEMARLFAETFDLPPARVHRTGQPRTDALFRPSPVRLDGFDPPLPAHAKRILYCPTWREGTPVELFPFPDRDLEAVQRFLEAHGAVLFVRTHPNDRGRLEKRDRRLVPLQGDVVPEITDALPLFDVLLTDYSSVYYDFLLLDRPTVFIPYDLEAYARSPGFYLPFERIAPEPWAATQAELLAALDRALRTPDADAMLRADVRRLVYDHVDDGATGRVLQVLTRR